MDHHELQSRRTFRSEDGRRVLNEAVETIHPPGEEPLTMCFANVMELNDDGLIARLDIYWKMPRECHRRGSPSSRCCPTKPDPPVGSRTEVTSALVW